jgi:hypothetical protein
LKCWLNLPRYMILQQCDQCNYSTTRRRTSVAHVKSDYDNIEDHKCKVLITQRRTLVAHVKSVHDNIKDHMCDLCNYSGTSIKRGGHGGSVKCLNSNLQQLFQVGYVLEFGEHSTKQQKTKFQT